MDPRENVRKGEWLERRKKKKTKPLCILEEGVGESDSAFRRSRSETRLGDEEK